MADTPDLESGALQAEGQKDGLDRFGNFHAARSTKLGKRLKVWYWVALGWLTLTLATYCFHTWYFEKISCTLNSALKALAGANAVLSVNQVLIVYYSTKLGLLAILLIPLVWIFKRITHIQALRSAHADKEILANTLQAVLYSGIDDVRAQACEIGFKEMFSSACDIAGRRSKKGTIEIKAIKEILDTIKELLPPKI